MSRLYPEVEGGYECCSPVPLSPSSTLPPAGARDASGWRFKVLQGTTKHAAVQTAADASGPAIGRHSAGFAKACTAAAVSSTLSAVALSPTAGGWSLAAMRGRLAAGESARVEVTLAVAAASADGQCARAQAQAVASSASSFPPAWAGVPAAYEERWQAAFDHEDDGIFEGNFPTLDTADDELARVYYGSLMSMMLVNKRGLNTSMQVEEAPSGEPAAAGCAGTYVALRSTGAGTGTGKPSPPFQLHAGGGDTLEAQQYAGRTAATWSTGSARVVHPPSTYSETRPVILMTYDSGLTDQGTVEEGTNCSRIRWAKDGSSWVRIRPAGEWNMFVAAGALLGNTAFYLWDTSGASLLWTLLAPTSMATANNVFASADPLVKNACDYVSMATAGKYYAFSPISAFQSIANEIRIGGRAAALRRIPLTNRTLVEQLVFTANEYLRLPAFNGTRFDRMTDFGHSASNFLECQATYLHGVAALQASSVWMLREAAAAVRAAGPAASNRTDAAELEARADALLAQLLPQLQGGADGGWWWMLYPAAGAPKRVEGRFVHDFLYVGQAIADDLSAVQRGGMSGFFNRELRTPNFVRAMSQRDPSASSTGSRRADHNQWGSWDGWAGGSITALANLGDLDSALSFARSLGANLGGGPFGQAHRVFGAGEGAAGEMARPSRKDQSWMAVCSGYIADGIIRGLFGFQPEVLQQGGGGAAPRLRAVAAARGFEGELKHVRYNGRMYTISAGAGGVSAEEEK